MHWPLILAAAAAATASSTIEMSQQESATVQQAINRGALMYHYDQAAWHGTDELRSKTPDLLSLSGGWIVDGPAEAPEIIFFDKDESNPHAIFIADLKDDRMVSSHATDATFVLDPSRKRMIAALRAAKRAIGSVASGPCTKAPFNTVVIPPADKDAPITVYMLTAQTEAGTFPIGGHYALTVDAKGMVTSSRAFSKFCINMTPPPDKGQPTALFVTHLLDPVPTETHVFSMLAAHVPIYVGTSAGIWSISAPRGRPQIQLIKRDAEKSTS